MNVTWKAKINILKQKVMRETLFARRSQLRCVAWKPDDHVLCHETWELIDHQIPSGLVLRDITSNRLVQLCPKRSTSGTPKFENEYLFLGRQTESSFVSWPFTSSTKHQSSQKFGSRIDYCIFNSDTVHCRKSHMRNTCHRYKLQWSESEGEQHLLKQVGSRYHTDVGRVHKTPQVHIPYWSR